MKNLLRKLLLAWHKWRLNADLKIAIDRAKELRYRSHKKHLVIYMGTRFVVYEKQELEEVIRRGGVFKRGVSYRQLAKMAVFITD